MSKFKKKSEWNNIKDMTFVQFKIIHYFEYTIVNGRVMENRIKIRFGGRPNLLKDFLTYGTIESIDNHEQIQEHSFEILGERG